MSDSRVLKVEILGDSKGAQAALRQLGDAGEQAEGRLGAASAKVQDFGKKTAQVGAGLTAGLTLPLVGLGAVAFKEAEEAQKTAAQTAAVIKSTGGAAQVSAAQVDELASALSKKAGIDDEVIASGANMLLTFTNIKNAVGEGNNIFDQATTTALDMSVALGTDVTQSSMMLGKALNDPIQGVSALRRVGVQLTDQQEEQIKSMVASGDTMGAQKVILGELTREFGGSAEAQATSAGKAKVAVGNLAETVGRIMAPAFERVSGVLSGVADWFEKLSPEVQTAIVVGAGLLAVVGPLVTAFGGLVTVIGFLISPVGLVVVAVAALVAGLVIAYRESETFRQFIADLGTTAVEVFNDIRDWVGQAITDVSQFLRENRSTFEEWGGKLEEIVGRIVAILSAQFEVARAIIETAVSVISDLWNRFGAQLWEHIKTHIGAVLDVISGAFRIIQGIWDIFAGIFTGDWSRVWGGIKDVFGGIWEVIKGIVEIAINWISTVIGATMATISAIWSGAWEGIKGVFVAIWDGIKSAIASAIGFVIDMVTGAVTTMLDLASHLPFVGGKFKGLANDIRGMANDAKEALGIIPDRNVQISSKFIHGTAQFGIKWATGGLIPGAGDGDTVPAWLTPGEYVVRKSAVQAVGVDALEHLNAQGYAAGGYVGGSGAGPWVGMDYALPGSNAIGAWADSVNDTILKKVADSAEQYLRDHPMGVGSGWGEITNYLSAVGEPYTVTSTTGGTHAPGSYHYQGKAVDLVSGNMGHLFNVLTGIASSLAELFYDPAGYSIKNGGSVGWTVGGHRDHVHAATFDAGGWLQPGMTMAYNGTGSPERVGGSRGTIVLEVPLVLDGRELARGTVRFTLEELQKMADRGQRLFPAP